MAVTKKIFSLNIRSWKLKNIQMMKIDRLMAFGLNVGYMKTFKLKKKKKKCLLIIARNCRYQYFCKMLTFIILQSTVRYSQFMLHLFDVHFAITNALIYSLLLWHFNWQQFFSLWYNGKHYDTSIQSQYLNLKQLVWRKLNLFH